MTNPATLPLHTPDLTERNFAALAALFPNAVTEAIVDGEVVRAIDADVLRQEISAAVVEGKEERYQFTWPDKKQSVLLANSPIAATLRPCREESVDFDNTENLYIEGDNLDVLKLLQETYLNRVKMIYIDPPYNTGNDFVYNDDFVEDMDEFYARDYQYDEDGNHMVKNLDSNGHFHMDWLNMIYPRLRLARDFLTDDGVIFISFDENELVNIGKVCDEVFGRTNFVECLVFDKKAAAKGVPSVNMAVGVHEYIFVYCKNVNKFPFLGIKRTIEDFSNPDNDYRGLWRNTNIKSTTSETRYSIVDPDTGNMFTDTWAFAPSELQKMIDNKCIIFPKDENGQPRAKEFYAEFNRENIPIKSNLGLFDTQWNTEMIVKLMGGKYFQNSKHLKLIKYITRATADKSSIILDFFSGSATTAHAVMQLNAEDGGKRKFIMVQLPEICDENSEAAKAGYKNICEIGKERIRRAGKKIKGDNKNKESIENLDTGFRVLKLDSTNIKDVYYRLNETPLGQLDLLADNIKSDRSDEDLLFQVMLDLGIPLSAKIKQDDPSRSRRQSVPCQ
jgi:adenine-specific DNA-methyltransferase